jgi:hypothetical protein
VVDEPGAARPRRSNRRRRKACRARRARPAAQWRSPERRQSSAALLAYFSVLAPLPPLPPDQFTYELQIPLANLRIFAVHCRGCQGLGHTHARAARAREATERSCFFTELTRAPRRSTNAGTRPRPRSPPVGQVARRRDPQAHGPRRQPGAGHRGLAPRLIAEISPPPLRPAVGIGPSGKVSCGENVDGTEIMRRPNSSAGRDGR